MISSITNNVDKVDKNKEQTILKRKGEKRGEKCIDMVKEIVIDELDEPRERPRTRSIAPRYSIGEFRTRTKRQFAQEILRLDCCGAAFTTLSTQPMNMLCINIYIYLVPTASKCVLDAWYKREKKRDVRQRMNCKSVTHRPCRGDLPSLSHLKEIDLNTPRGPKLYNYMHNELQDTFLRLFSLISLSSSFCLYKHFYNLNDSPRCCSYWKMKFVVSTKFLLTEQFCSCSFKKKKNWSLTQFAASNKYLIFN